jgi:hypothetical protein
LRQLEVGDFPEQLVRRLEQDARAVARVDLGAGRAAVLEGVEHVERSFDGRVAGIAAQARDSADATVVVLEVRVVEARGLRSLESMHAVGTCGRAHEGYGGECGMLAAGEAEKRPGWRIFLRLPTVRRT